MIQGEIFLPCSNKSLTRLANNQRKLDKEKESEKGEEETEGTEDSEPMATAAMRFDRELNDEVDADEGTATFSLMDDRLDEDEVDELDIEAGY